MTIICVFDVETTGLLPKLSPYSNQKINPETLPYITQLSYALYDIEAKMLIKTFNQYVNVPAHVSISEKVSTLTGITREKLNELGVDINVVLESFYDAYSRSDIAVAHNIEFDGRMIELETKRNFTPLKTYNGTPLAKHSVPQGQQLPINELNGMPLLLRLSPISNLHRCKMHFQDDTESLSIFADQIYNDNIKAQYKMTDIVSICTMKTSVDLCNIEKINSRGPYKKFPTLCELHEKLFNESPKNLHNSMVDVLICLKCYLKKDLDIDLSSDEFASYIEVAIQ